MSSSSPNVSKIHCRVDLRSNHNHHVAGIVPSSGARYWAWIALWRTYLATREYDYTLALNICAYTKTHSQRCSWILQSLTSTLIPSTQTSFTIKMLSKVLFGLIAAKAVMCSPIADPVVPDIDFTPDTLAEAQALTKFLQDLDENSE